MTYAGRVPEQIVVPPTLVAAYPGPGEPGPEWVAALPRLAATYLDRWRLRLAGPARSGVVALVLPVRQAHGTRAVLKLQPVDDETGGEPVALRAWAGQDAVRLLDHDPATGTMLLEWLDASRPLSAIPTGERSLQILSELLARLLTVPAPAGLRTLSDLATGMLDRVPQALAALGDVGDRRLVRGCAEVVAELAPTAGDRLLHWDLHDGNILAGVREPWLAIDPKPLAGDPGFELLPALRSRWDDVTSTRDPAGAVRRRMDRMVEVLGIDWERAAGWTLGRVLQDTLWTVEDGATAVDPVLRTIARAVSSRTWPVVPG